MRILLSTLLCTIYILIPSYSKSEVIKGHFNRLTLMRDMAKNDGNDRAVMNIEYISDTPKGEFFEVDDLKPPIESLIYKIDKTKQKKPLQTTRDEKIVIKYFHRVDDFASEYYSVVDLVISNKIRPFDAVIKFEKISPEYKSNLATIYRAISACLIAAKKPDRAYSYARRASDISKYDLNSYILMSIGKYGLEDISASRNFINRAKNIDPTLKEAQNSWELQYVSEKEPNIFLGWAKKLNVEYFMNFEHKQ